MKLPIVSILTVVAAATAFANPAANKAIPTDGVFPVEIFAVKESPEIQAIAKKFKEAMAKDKEFFGKYISEHGGGGNALPWHEKMGVTKAEYERILKSAENKDIVYEKAANAKIKFTTTSKGTVISSNRTWPFFDKLSLSYDPKQNEMSGPIGKLAYSGEVKANENQKFTGPWDGHCWKVLESDSPTIEAKSVKKSMICVGKFKKDSLNVFIYESRDTASSDPVRNTEFMMKWKS